MDEFLREIYVEIYKKWILGHHIEGFNIYLKNENKIYLDTEYSHGEVNFYQLSIIELSVTNKASKEIEFYLHFQMNTLKHSVELFNEMITAIQTVINEPKLKILLSCTGGLTTGYFASLLNEGANLLSLDYEFSAVPYTELYRVGENYDVILLAPQISYMLPKIEQILKGKDVIAIPPVVFARYDVGAAIALVSDRAQKKVKKKEGLTVQWVNQNYEQVLSIALVRNNQRVVYYYLVSGDGNKVLYQNEAIKSMIAISDIYDIIDTVIAQFPDIKVIGISLPGIINKGHLSLERDSALDNNFDEEDILTGIQQRYGRYVVIENDVNSAAVGFYASQNQYENLSFIFQPINGKAGIGNICNGQLIRGKHYVAGEAQYLPLNLSEDNSTLCKIPEETIETVAKTIAALISIIDPDKIVLTCPLILDIQELKVEIAKLIPEKYIPEIELVEHFYGMDLLGVAILALQEYEKQLENTSK